MNVRKSRRGSRAWLATAAIFLALVSMALVRAVLLDVRLRPLADCKGCMALLALQHDAAVLGATLVALGVAWMAPSSLLRRGLKVLVCVTVALFGIDLLVIFLYNMRLVVEDFFKYGREAGGVVTIARHLMETWEGVGALAVLAVVTASMVAFLRSSLRPGRRASGTVILAGLALIAVGLIPTRRVFAHSWAFRNFFAINLDRALLASYSDEFAEALQGRMKDLRDGEVCSPRPVSRPNVLMVVLEGFSMYQSRFFSGLADLTPNLDRIAGNHTAFTRFWANGFTTENGLIALLGGEVPVPGPGQVVFGGGFAFDGFSDLPRSLPGLFDAQGYHTAFLTTGDLSFSGKERWLRALGFQESIGHDDPFYDGWPRLHFNAAPDSALYLRALRWLEEYPGDRPFFLVVETVSSHHPFIEPGTRKKSEEAVFRYADRQLGHFYDALVESGTLESALLIVASDHRTMTPVRPAEMERFGDEARALVPFVIADPEHPGARRIDQHFQQVDLATSVQAMLSGRSCPTLVRGDLLSVPPTPPTCVLHARGEDRGRVDVACGGDAAAIRLRGDRTRVEAGWVPYQDLLVDQINFERLERRGVRRWKPPWR